MSSTISPNMNLIVPTVGQEPGPQYATDVNNSLGIIDQHDHSSGSGVQVTPAGLSISSDLSFQSNNGINFRSVRFTAQSAPLGTASDLGCLYESGVDLYYNDGLGNQVRLTQSGAVAGTPGSIANLTSPASATYVAANQTFVWQSAANTPSNMDGASYIFRNLVANSFGLTLNPPNAMAANYALTLPTLPASQKIMTLDNTGAMSAPYVLDNSTIVVSGGTIQVPTSGIGTAQIADGAVTSVKIANGAVTNVQIASNTILNSNITANTITASSIANNTITSVQQAAPSKGKSALTTASAGGSPGVLVSIAYSIPANSLGRPIYVYLTGGTNGTITVASTGFVEIFDASSLVSIAQFAPPSGTTVFAASGFSGIYFPTALTGTFSLEAQNGGITNVSIGWVQL